LKSSIKSWLKSCFLASSVLAVLALVRYAWIAVWWEIQWFLYLLIFGAIRGIWWDVQRERILFNSLILLEFQIPISGEAQPRSVYSLASGQTNPPS